MLHSIVAACLFLFAGEDIAQAQSERPVAPAEPTASQPAKASDAPSSHADGVVDRRPGWMPSYAGPWDAKIRSTRSKDGKDFAADTQAVVSNADAPTIARLPDDRLIVVFEYYPRDDRRAFGSLAAVFSGDEGKTWTKPIALSVERLPRSMGRPQGPAIVIDPEGIVRLAFTCEDRKGRHRCLLAESTDWAKDEAARPPRGKDRPGPHFKILGPIEFDEKDLQLDDIGFYYRGTECHITGTIVGVAGTRYFGMYQGDRRFIRTTRVSVADVGGRGSILQTDDGLRCYATSPAGILSALSKDGSNWQRDKGLRMPGLRDPAVAKLKDGSLLMLCVVPPPAVRGDGDIGDSNSASKKKSAERTQSNEAESPAEEWWDYGQSAADSSTDPTYESEENAADEQNAIDADDMETNEGLADAEDDSEELPAQDAVDESQAEEAVADETQDADAEAETPDDQSFVDEQWSYQDFLYAGLGVPIPDFSHKVNYRQWLQDRHDPNAVADNAYDYYASLMLGPDGTPDHGDYLRGLPNMFTDSGGNRRVGPWDPNAHPDWEDASARAAEYVPIFRAAASRPDYVNPIQFSDQAGQMSSSDPESGDLLLNVMLPNLSIHRYMVRQVLSDAWRAPDGKVDSHAMIQAIDTSLSAAEHIADGDFLIEMLVAHAEQISVEDTARRALANDVFSPDEMEQVLDILIEKNRQAPPPSQWVAGELAMCLDTTQYLFGPVDPDREARLNPDRVKNLMADMNMGEWISRLPTQEEIDTSDGKQTADSFVEYYQRFGEMADHGYPEVTSEDLENLTQQYVGDNYLSRFMLPSLGRVYDVAHRHEASRRATQLTYAIHLYRSENGDWPDSLDDINPRYSEGARTDPFTRQDFVYRRTAEGFILYTTSANGRDDGGRHTPRWEDGRADGEGSTNDESTSDDYVFWPPQD